MLIETRHLEMLRAIRSIGTVTGAARQLKLSQPAVSHALGKLEERLGVTLFRRDPSGMVPTPEGERLLSAAEKVLPELERAEHDVAQLASGQQGTLRITTECYTCYHWLPGLLARFRDEFPGVVLQIVPEAIHRRLAALREGAADIAIVHSPGDEDEVETRALFDDELVVLVAPGHAWARRSHADPEDFADETLVVHGRFDESFLLRHVLHPTGTWPDRVLELQLTEAVLAAVREGIGITVMARWAGVRRGAPPATGRRGSASGFSRDATSFKTGGRPPGRLRSGLNVWYGSPTRNRIFL